MTDSSGSPRPAAKRRRRPAQGARYLVTGISASAVLGGITAFGIADLRAAHAEPAVAPGVDVTTAAASSGAPPATPPIIRVVIRRSASQPTAMVATQAPEASAVGATVPAAPVPVARASAPVVAATPAPAPAGVAPAQSRSKAS